jgi:hypothetical protein
MSPERDDGVSSYTDRVVSVLVPDEQKDSPEPPAAEGEAEVRESIRIQSLIATIGSTWG